MKSIKNLESLVGKKVLVRVDFNVPIKDGKVEDDFRIKKALPTINFLLEKGAEKIILIIHLGKDGSDSIAPVVEHFFKISGLSKGKIEFLDNIRKFPGEMTNDPKLAKELSEKGDIFVNDAFSVSHRAQASVVGIPAYLPSYAGFQLEEEVKNLSKALEPEHPFLFILGGAKFETKLPLLRKFLDKADDLFIGGALLNDLLKAKGYEVGQSLTSKGSEGIEEILKSPKLILPDEVLVQAGTELVNKKTDEIKKEETILDIGEDSTKNLEPYIQKAKLILWNGPLGKYENGGDKATKEILKMVLASKAEVIIGGGDIVAVLSELVPDSSKLDSNIFVSTGGGATLDFLASGTLPGITALR